MDVLSITPTEGSPAIPVTVKLQFLPDQQFHIWLRLVFGDVAVATSVRRVGPNQWVLHANVPEFEPSVKSVPVTVQVLDYDDTVLSETTFASFTLWTAVDHPSDAIVEESKYTPMVSSPIPDSLSFEITTPLESMCSSWKPIEVRAGRRLVKFKKSHIGSRLLLTCEPVLPDKLKQSDVVISCISRNDTEFFYVTSVDIIYLLEHITEDDFPIEEKNRIRRNLECFHPTVVSRHRPGFERFFQRIMEFDDPKPRNVEKDIKVFEWKVLGAALGKVLSKYALTVIDV